MSYGNGYMLFYSCVVVSEDHVTYCSTFILYSHTHITQLKIHNIAALIELNEVRELTSY